jgi:hypothetical protein
MGDEIVVIPPFCIPVIRSLPGKLDSPKRQRLSCFPMEQLSKKISISIWAWKLLAAFILCLWYWYGNLYGDSDWSLLIPFLPLALPNRFLVIQRVLITLQYVLVSLSIIIVLFFYLAFTAPPPGPGQFWSDEFGVYYFSNLFDLLPLLVSLALPVIAVEIAKRAYRGLLITSVALIVAIIPLLLYILGIIHSR